MVKKGPNSSITDLVAKFPINRPTSNTLLSLPSSHLKKGKKLVKKLFLLNMVVRESNKSEIACSGEKVQNVSFTPQRPHNYESCRQS